MIVTDENSDKREFDLIFELNSGLFENVSGAGSTLVDGYITYRVSILNSVSGPDPVIATSQATVQGLLRPWQNYRWVHRMEHPDVEDDTEVRPEVEIIDFKWTRHAAFGNHTVTMSVTMALNSTSVIRFVDLLCEGLIAGLVGTEEGIFLDETPGTRTGSSRNFASQDGLL